jgi:hypothetical protein
VEPGILGYVRAETLLGELGPGGADVLLPVAVDLDAAGHQYPRRCARW